MLSTKASYSKSTSNANAPTSSSVRALLRSNASCARASLRPMCRRRFCSYMRSSAMVSTSLTSDVSLPCTSTMPKQKPVSLRSPFTRLESRSSARSILPRASAASPSTTQTNSSPERRKANSSPESWLRAASAAARSTTSPSAWPNRSLISFRRLMSNRHTLNTSSSSRSRSMRACRRPLPTRRVSSSASSSMLAVFTSVMSTDCCRCTSEPSNQRMRLSQLRYTRPVFELVSSHSTKRPGSAASSLSTGQNGQRRSRLRCSVCQHSVPSGRSSP